MPKTGEKSRRQVLKTLKMKKLLFASVLMLSSLFAFSSTTPWSGSNSFSIKPIQEKEEPKLIDIIKSIDVNVMSSVDETLVRNYLIVKNAEIKNYIATKYPQFGPVDVIDVNDHATPVFGLFYAMWEANDFKTLPGSTNDVQSMFSKPLPLWLICTLEVIGVGYGLSGIATTLATFETASAWRIAKFFVRKYISGWLGTAVAIYQVATTCF
jgi:hypothetical protein